VQREAADNLLIVVKAVLQSEAKRDNLVQLPWAHLRLPPFPQVAVRVLQLARNENIQLQRLADLIASDPAFASEVLTIANSALYAPRWPANNILQAITILGANHLQGICITVGVRAYMGKALRSASLRNLWRHNLACALIARRLAASGAIDPDDAYTAGILHDIGRFALASLQPREYATVLDQHRGSAQSLLQQERELFGWDHCETGRKLISDWKLPAALDSIVAEHHCACREDGVWNLAEIIKVSCKMADAAGFPAFPGCSAAPLPDLLAALPHQEHARPACGADSLVAEVERQIHAIESA